MQNWPRPKVTAVAENFGQRVLELDAEALGVRRFVS